MLTRIDLMILQISAGELGTEAQKLEKHLSDIFQIANQWDAILLLDEADVFLERRSSQDLHRNGLVSVFLRKLEYCTGILFLTTNRVSEFDEAILSRIHLLLRYENLKKKARKNIWKSFLKQAETQNGAVIIGPKHLESLTEAELNGRQVCQLFHISPQGLPLTASRSRMPWRRRMLWRLSRELRWLILISSRLSRQAKTSSASFMAFMPSTAYISDGICVRIRSN
jgi:ATPase family associated with various cellular activities (AAA)